MLAIGVVKAVVDMVRDDVRIEDDETLSVADRATLSNMCPEYGATSVLIVAFWV